MGTGSVARLEPKQLQRRLVTFMQCCSLNWSYIYYIVGIDNSILDISIFTLSDLGVSSNLIGLLSFADE